MLNLFGNDIKDIFVSWRKALRCIWNLHPQTHGDLLAVISGLLPVQISFYNRFCKFITNCLCSKNSIVKTVSNVAINNPYSSCCSNYQKLFNRDSTCKIVTFMDEWFNREKASEATNIQVKELITVRDGLSYVPGFSIEEVTDLLTILCIM